MLWQEVIENFDRIDLVKSNRNSKSVEVIGKFNGKTKRETYVFTYGTVGKAFALKISQFIF